MTLDDFDLGRHEALIQRLVAQGDQLVADVASIKNALAEQRGARRVAAGVWGIAGGAIVAAVTAGFRLLFAHAHP